MVNATNRGMFEEVMFCWAKMLCHWWPFKPAMFPVIAMTIHPEVQRTFCLSYILLLTFAARNEVDNICCFTVGVTFQLDNRTRWRLNSFCVQYHFASLTPGSPAWLCTSSHKNLSEWSRDGAFTSGTAQQNMTSSNMLWLNSPEFRPGNGKLLDPPSEHSKASRYQQEWLKNQTKFVAVCLSLWRSIQPILVHGASCFPQTYSVPLLLLSFVAMYL